MRWRARVALRGDGAVKSRRGRRRAADGACANVCGACDPTGSRLLPLDLRCHTLRGLRCRPAHFHRSRADPDPGRSAAWTPPLWPGRRPSSVQGRPRRTFLGQAATRGADCLQSRLGRRRKIGFLKAFLRHCSVLGCRAGRARLVQRRATSGAKDRSRQNVWSAPKKRGKSRQKASGYGSSSVSQ